MVWEPVDFVAGCGLAIVVPSLKGTCLTFEFLRDNYSAIIFPDKRQLSDVG